MSDFAFDAAPGLPENLPAGEKLLWQGTPCWSELAIRAFHARGVIVYFFVLGGLQALAQISTGAPVPVALKPFLWLLPMGIGAAGILAALAWAAARTTIYTITNKRIVMRIGIALPMSINLPFNKLDAASVRVNANGAGDITVAPRKGEKLAYLLLWPHVKPWEFSRPQPALRGIANVERAAKILSEALAGQSAAIQRRETAIAAPQLAAA